MPRYNIYLREISVLTLAVIFEYLKSIGQIPTAATEIGKYRAQCLDFAIGYTVGGLAKDEPELFKKLADKAVEG